MSDDKDDLRLEDAAPEDIARIIFELIQRVEDLEQRTEWLWKTKRP